MGYRCLAFFLIGGTVARAQKKTGNVAMGDMIKRLNKKFGIKSDLWLDYFGNS